MCSIYWLHKQINNTQIDSVKDIDVVMNIYTYIEYSKNYSQTSRRLWQYYRDEPALNANGTVIESPAANKNIALTLNKK